MMRLTLITILGMLSGLNLTFAQQWGGSATTANSIYRSGNVGIGPVTTIPGFASLYLSNGSGLNPSIFLQNSDAAVDNRVWNVLAQGGRFRIITQSDAFSSVQDAFIIHRNGVNITVTSFPNGNVGIGTIMTNNPNSYKLAVNGKIGAKEVQVENTSSTWADYVFEPDYRLSSLEEIEAFIKVNKHLPEIPSQKDIEVNGHKLGEMDVLLLKKIEEITLYLITLKKQVTKLELENEQLKGSANK